MKIANMEPGTKFLDEDGDLSVLLPLKERNVEFQGSTQPCRFYSTLRNGEPFVVAVAIPSSCEVELYDDRD